jgi:acyl-coenzyme A thioesterase PaaI-like protein
MGINQTIVHSSTPPNGPVRCVARCRPDGTNRGIADVVFEDEDGQPFTEFRGVELILRPTPNKS